MHYRDLALDEWLFEGDAAQSPQYQLYREMRDASGDTWDRFCPGSNLRWIAYVLDQLLVRGSRAGRKERTLYDQLAVFAQKIGAFSRCREALQHVPPPP